MSTPLHENPSYKPSAFYFREALRSARTKREAIDYGMQAVRELEWLKQWIRERGFIPPRRFILSTEAEAKGLIPQTSACDEVLRFPHQ